MQIAIIGTKGIPNKYGGFEEFAENLAIQLSNKNLDVLVYNPNYYKSNFNYPRIKIINKYCPEKLFGPFATIIYDYLCLCHALKNSDLIIACGYSSLAPALFMNKKHTHKIIISMDGLEWKRDKWNFLAKKYIKWTEKFTVSTAKHFVSDNEEIQNYYRNEYNLETNFISYGATPFYNHDFSKIVKYGILEKDYFLIISRPEPENNIEMIIEGFLESDSAQKLVIILDYARGFGKRIYNKFNKNNRILFVGTIYNSDELNNLRYFSKMYFHGHSVGGTNPSLLEAMACKCDIVAHKNKFNISVLGKEAYYYDNKNEIKNIVNKSEYEGINKMTFIELNFNKIIEKYNWERITQKYIELFINISK